MGKKYICTILQYLKNVTFKNYVTKLIINTVICRNPIYSVTVPVRKPVPINVRVLIREAENFRRQPVKMLTHLFVYT